MHFSWLNLNKHSRQFTIEQCLTYEPENIGTL